MIIDDVVELIRAQHRTRRYAMKVQQKIDRALECFVRRGFTDWQPDLPEAERERFNREVARLIEAARDGEGDDALADIVAATDQSREKFDAIRGAAEAAMRQAATELPVREWVEGVPGVGMLGLATIVAETGALHNYANPAKVWKRLGYAPYDGHAGSTWRRKTWRPRALTDEEWVENPFNKERYAMMAMVAQFLWMKQWRGAARSGNGAGRPSGPYGEVYARRRRHTAVTHPDWTKGHGHNDALRVMMKRFLADLWMQWTRSPGHGIDLRDGNDAERAAGHPASDAQPANAGGAPIRKRKLRGHSAVDAQPGNAAKRAVGPSDADTQEGSAGGAPIRERRLRGQSIGDTHLQPAAKRAAGRFGSAGGAPIRGER